MARPECGQGNLHLHGGVANSGQWQWAGKYNPLMGTEGGLYSHSHI